MRVDVAPVLCDPWTLLHLCGFRLQCSPAQTLGCSDRASGDWVVPHEEWMVVPRMVVPLWLTMTNSTEDFLPFGKNHPH